MFPLAYVLLTDHTGKINSKGQKKKVLFIRMKYPRIPL